MEILLIIVDGITYKATPTFDREGCKGRDIYDGSSNFVERMKILEDGLWIVDENNVQVEKSYNGNLLKVINYPE